MAHSTVRESLAVGKRQHPIVIGFVEGGRIDLRARAVRVFQQASVPHPKVFPHSLEYRYAAVAQITPARVAIRRIHIKESMIF